MINGVTKATADQCGMRTKATALTAATPEIVVKISSSTDTAYSSLRVRMVSMSNCVSCRLWSRRIADADRHLKESFVPVKVKVVEGKEGKVARVLIDGLGLRDLSLIHENINLIGDRIHIDFS